MLRLRVNEKSLNLKVTKALESGEEQVRDKLKQVARSLAQSSPVLTGAYAESFSVDDAGGRSIRRVSSHGRPKSRDVERFQSIAYRNMATDIENLRLETTKALFKNGAPHANFVERKYQVFGSTKDRFR